MNKIIVLFSFTAMVCAAEAAASCSVVDFGADGSDAVDDAYAIQNALNTAKGAISGVEYVSSGNSVTPVSLKEISGRGRRYDDSVLVFGLTGTEGGTVVLTAQWTE